MPHFSMSTTDPKSLRHGASLSCHMRRGSKAARLCCPRDGFCNQLHGSRRPHRAEQRSAASCAWARESEVRQLEETGPASLMATARSLDADLVLIDTWPSSEADAVHVAALSDLVLVPTRPTILDLRAIVVERIGWLAPAGGRSVSALKMPIVVTPQPLIAAHRSHRLEFLDQFHPAMHVQLVVQVAGMRDRSRLANAHPLGDLAARGAVEKREAEFGLTR